MRYAPRDPEAYGKAMAWLAARYGTRVAAYEVWNEPNSDSFFKSPDPVKDYTALVKAAYRQVKAVAPEVTVLAGALQTSDYVFAEAMFRAGLGRDFDGFSIHPYSGDIAPDNPLPNWKKDSFISGPPAVHEVLVRNGAGDKKLWLTEAGWSACLRRDGEHWENGVNEDVQARYLTDAFRIAASWDFVEAIIWYDLQDDSDDPMDMWGQAGLYRFDGSKRPAWSAFKDAAAQTATGTPAAAVGAAPVTEAAKELAEQTKPAPGKQGQTKQTKKAETKQGAKKRATLSASARKRGRKLVVRGRTQGSSKVRVRVLSNPRGRGRARVAKARVAVVRASSTGAFVVRLRVPGATVVRVTAGGASVKRAVRR
jgi:hypothetical protein